MYSLYPVFKHTGWLPLSLNYCHFDSDVPINLHYLTLALTLEYLNIQEYVLALSHCTPAASFLFWQLSTTPCRCRGLLWQLIYSVTYTHTHTEDLLWTKDRDLYLTTHSTHNRLTSMPSAGCGIPAIPGSKRPQMHTFERAASGIGPSVP
jgi:hypothetical protein